MNIGIFILLFMELFDRLIFMKCQVNRAITRRSPQKAENEDVNELQSTTSQKMKQWSSFWLCVIELVPLKWCNYCQFELHFCHYKYSKVMKKSKVYSRKQTLLGGKRFSMAHQMVTIGPCQLMITLFKSTCRLQPRNTMELTMVR